MATSPPARRAVGLLGGTFDPPHLAHLVVAEIVRDALALDEVRLLVAGDPWMKAGVSSARHRVAMAELAAATLDGLTVDDREARRDGPTYTADTLAELTRERPDVAWHFLLGADAAASLPAWHRVEEALDLATFVVVTRPGIAPLDHPLARQLVPVEVPPIGVSSTDLRRRVAAGRTVRTLVPPTVIHYIERHALYRPAR